MSRSSLPMRSFIATSASSVLMPEVDVEQHPVISTDIGGPDALRGDVDALGEREARAERVGDQRDRLDELAFDARSLRLLMRLVTQNAGIMYASTPRPGETINAERAAEDKRHDEHKRIRRSSRMQEVFVGPQRKAARSRSTVQRSLGPRPLEPAANGGNRRRRAPQIAPSALSTSTRAAGASRLQTCLLQGAELGRARRRCTDRGNEPLRAARQYSISATSSRRCPSRVDAGLLELLGERRRDAGRHQLAVESRRPWRRRSARSGRAPAS